MNSQRKAGEKLGSPEQQAKGAAKQVEGKGQKAVGDMQDSSRKSRTAES